MRARDPYKKPDSGLEDISAAEKARAVVKAVAATQDGRALMRYVLDASQVNAPAFSTNALQMAYAEGRRSVGLLLMSLLTTEDFFRITKEKANG